MAAGPIAQYLFEPLMVREGVLASTLGRVIGTGPGRGIGLLFIIMGLLTLLIVAAGYLYPRLRLLEDEVNDVIPEPELAAASTGKAGAPVSN
jgi:hypothetical protein